MTSEHRGSFLALSTIEQESSSIFLDKKKKDVTETDTIICHLHFLLKYDFNDFIEKKKNNSAALVISLLCSKDAQTFFLETQ